MAIPRARNRPFPAGRAWRYNRPSITRGVPMRTSALPYAILALLAVSASRCSSNAKAPAQEASSEVRQYDARAFFTTTSYALSSGYAWKADDSALLVSADSTGIFNAYALPAAGGGAEPLTTSTTDSTFAVSWFPDDGRVLVTADRGGNEISHLHVREASATLRDLTEG